jgi:hypothetical protein
MKRPWATLLVVALLPVSSNPVLGRYPLVPQGKKIVLRADLDGDGRIDTATVSFLKGLSVNADFFQVVVGRDTLVYSGVALEGTASLVDIDKSDPFREIAITEKGQGDEANTVYFVRYSEKGLALIGELSGTLNESLLVDGSGTIRTRCSGTILETWDYPCSVRFYEEAGVLAPVPQAFMPMNTAVTLKMDLPLYLSPEDKRIVGTIKKGEQATIDLSDDQQWCRIRAASGLTGWFWTRGGRVLVDFNEVNALDVFDGLDMAN